MKHLTLIILFPLLFIGNIFSQNVLDAVYVKETNPTRLPFTYPFLGEKDVMWSKRIWRVIDLNEKINLPLKYPLTKQTTDRRNLIDVLMDAIQEGNLTAYSFIDDEFTLPMTYAEILSRGGARIDTIQIPQPDPPYALIDTVIPRDFSRDKVIGFRIKEDWFFDKQLSEMKVRIIGIAPMIYAFDEAGNIREGNLKMPLFWVYYPDARQLLSKSDVFNQQNNAQRLTFDDVFQNRLFGSYIYKESNVYDRRIEDFKTGLSALLESEKIKDLITNFEHDMWEF